MKTTDPPHDPNRDVIGDSIRVFFEDSRHDRPMKIKWIKIPVRDLENLLGSALSVRPGREFTDLLDLVITFSIGPIVYKYVQPNVILTIENRVEFYEFIYWPEQNDKLDFNNDLIELCNCEIVQNMFHDPDYVKGDLMDWLIYKRDSQKHVAVGSLAVLG